MRTHFFNFLWGSVVARTWGAIAGCHNEANLPTKACERAIPKVRYRERHGFSIPSTWFQRLEGMSSTMLDTRLATYVLNRRGFPVIQFKTIVLSVQSKTSSRENSNTILQWWRSCVSSLAPQRRNRWFLLSQKMCVCVHWCPSNGDKQHLHMPDHTLPLETL